MRKIIPAAATAVLLLAGCETPQPRAIDSAKRCDDKPVVIVEVVRNAQDQLRLRVSEEPLYVCSPRKITWEIDRSQKADYEFRADSIHIKEDPANQFTNCRGPDGELDGRDKIKCNNIRTVRGGPWKYIIKVYPQRAGDTEPRPLDPYIFND